MPSRRNDVAACIVRKENWEEKEMHGKWMTFKHYDEIDATWKEVVTAMENNTLERCWVAKCSTLYYSPSNVGPGPTTTGVITVHTSKEYIQLVGEQFINIVKQDIKYKTNKTTLKDEYAYKGQRVKTRNLYYNEGLPTGQNPKTKCPGTVADKEDIWNVNEVKKPEFFSLGPRFYQWILTLENEELTALWHKIKQEIENGRIRAFKMVCPNKTKEHSKTEKPVFCVYVMEDQIESVGAGLISIVCRDIKLVRDNGLPPTILKWNNGLCEYEDETH